jgi:hypothetical protein
MLSKFSIQKIVPVILINFQVILFMLGPKMNTKVRVELKLPSSLHRHYSYKFGVNTIKCYELINRQKIHSISWSNILELYADGQMTES